MRYARINDEGTVEEIVDLDPVFVSGKLAADGGCRLRPLVSVDAPTYNPETHSRTYGLDISINEVTETWTIASLGPSAYKNAIKNEANRRIVIFFPEWRQLNLNAEKLALLEIKIERELTFEEQERLDQTNASLAWIKSVRDTSNAIEVMSPAAEDYRDDSLWPQNP